MADNFVTNAASGGLTFASFEASGSIHWPAGVCSWATSVGTPDVLVPVTLTAGLPVQPGTSTTWSVTNAGTFVVQENGAALTALQLIDDTVYTAGAGTPSKGLLFLASDGTNPQSVICTPTTGTIATSSNALVGASLLYGFNGLGSSWQRLSTDGGGQLLVSASIVTSTTIVVVGSGAHDDPVTGAPFRTAGYASAAAPTSVSADGDTVNYWALRNGSQVINLAVGGTLVTGSAGLPVAQQGTWNIGTVTTVSAVTSITNTVTVTGAGGTFPVTDSGGSLTVDAPVGTPVFVRLSDGTNPITTLPVSIAGTVTIAGAVTNAGTFAVQENGPALTALQIMDDWDNAASDGASVSGDVAHDAADAGEPVKLGAKAESGLSGITLVADGDRTNLHAGLDGVLIVRPHTNLEDVTSDRATNTDGASTAFAGGMAAPGSGIFLRITSVTICNSSASFCTVDLRDGSAGSVLWTLPVPATGGVVQTFDPPLKLSANTALAYDASAATTTLTISANGFKSKV